MKRAHRLHHNCRVSVASELYGRQIHKRHLNFTNGIETEDGAAISRAEAVSWEKAGCHCIWQISSVYHCWNRLGQEYGSKHQRVLDGIHFWVVFDWFWMVWTEEFWFQSDWSKPWRQGNIVQLWLSEWYSGCFRNQTMRVLNSRLKRETQLMGEERNRQFDIGQNSSDSDNFCWTPDVVLMTQSNKEKLS